MWPVITILIAVVAVGAGVFLAVRYRAMPDTQKVDSDEGTALLVLGIAFIAINTVFALTIDWGWYGIPIGIAFVAVGAQRRRTSQK